jgi:hypothetical protein
MLEFWGLRRMFRAGWLASCIAVRQGTIFNIFILFGQL